MPTPISNPHDTLNSLLDRMQFRADPLADATINAILGPWEQLPDAAAIAQLAAANDWATLAPTWQAQWQKLAAVSRTFAQWTDNSAIDNWQTPSTGLAPEAGSALKRYLQAGRALPAWADRDKLARAEALFMEYGALSVTMLFCSSLPECYVIPDLAAVLHATGKLETHTDYRIRATGAMIFPVMMRGGLTSPDGGGIAQILKVRLIHATVRNLILRGSPESTLAALPAPGTAKTKSAGLVPPLSLGNAPDNMHQTLFAHGWNPSDEGVPCDQEELAYTLLTFSYVFLRSMHKLGLPLSSADEEAYLHAWNVAGHVLGIERELMADTMDAAETMFNCMQARGRADRLKNPGVFDPRPALGNALVQSMEAVIPLPGVRPFPLLLTRYLCGAATSQDLGLEGPVSWFAQVLFAGFMFLVRSIDLLVRIVFPEFSIARLMTRVLGYHLMSKLLMDQTRPLKLPQHVLDHVSGIVDQWSSDPKAPAWMNSLEDRVTIGGSWAAPAQK
jgi:hypothetical protein